MNQSTLSLMDAVQHRNYGWNAQVSNVDLGAVMEGDDLRYETNVRGVRRLVTGLTYLNTTEGFWFTRGGGTFLPNEGQPEWSFRVQGGVPTMDFSFISDDEAFDYINRVAEDEGFFTVEVENIVAGMEVLTAAIAYGLFTEQYAVASSRDPEGNWLTEQNGRILPTLGSDQGNRLFFARF